MTTTQIQKFHLLNVSCGGCVKNIEKTLTAVNGIQQSEIDFAERLLTVTGDVSAATIITTIEEAGYGATLDDNS